MRVPCLILVSLAMTWSSGWASERLLQVFPLHAGTCETFSVGESGHSDRCVGPKASTGDYQLIIHDRLARINIEIVRPGSDRARVLRLSSHLGPGQRRFRTKNAFWYLEDDRIGVLALSFDVEPRPYELTIPLTLVIRFQDEEDACVIATLGEASRRTLDDVLADFEMRPCRRPFPQ